MTVAGVQIAIVHDAGPAAGRPARLERWFPDADLVVFGHSHLPEARTAPGGQLQLNPGSCTQRRRAPHHTYATVTLADGCVLDHRIVELG